MSVNKVILIGNLGEDPQINIIPSGDVVANFSVATTEKWKDRETGELQKHTEWHQVAVYGKRGERAGEWLKKGSKVYIEGSNRTNKWQGDDGKDRYTTTVVCSKFEPLDRRTKDTGDESNAGTQE